jgi:hypothetical protein
METVIRNRPGAVMSRVERRVEVLAAIILAIVAAVISPLGIEYLTGRPDLTFRVNAVSLTIDLFLAVVIAALLAQRRARRACFHALPWTLPLALLGGVEAAAIGADLANRIVPIENMSLLVHRSQWPGYLMSDARFAETQGLRLYRPWRGDGIVINELGLRTEPPRPKRPGEWRIAVTGGSTVWGSRVLDADTIPLQLQTVLRQATGGDITVYNFGIEGATLRPELSLLRRFRETYAIDQVLFYTGGNDVIFSYLGAVRGHAGPWLGAADTFELVKAAARLHAVSGETSPQPPQWLERALSERARTANSLRDAITAADDFCRVANLRCRFALQPMLQSRKTSSGQEASIAATVGRLYPGLDTLRAGIYRDALQSGPAGRVHDLSNAFDHTTAPYFIDLIHLGEAGNRAVAERLASLVWPAARE